jgi:predicted NBD/HSP70 family sugar kinase
VPYAGSRGAALVIANGPVICTCPQCGHLARHVVEDIASGPALAAAYAAGCRSEDVLRAAQTGDAQAIAVIDHAAQALGQVLALLVNALDPAKLVIGAEHSSSFAGRPKILNQFRLTTAQNGLTKIIL